MEPLSLGKEMGPLRCLAAAKPGACNLLQELQPEAQRGDLWLCFWGSSVVFFSKEGSFKVHIGPMWNLVCVCAFFFFLFVCFHVILLSVTLNNSFSLLLLTVLKYWGTATLSYLWDYINIVSSCILGTLSFCSSWQPFSDPVTGWIHFISLWEILVQ